MSTDAKISIIMPVYKVEQYVARAIESILQQTFQEYEFLIVDDGTPDNSGKICDEYARKDPRITVIHKENGGAPSARNTAMEIAKGKYFYFMDSDDWAEPGMLEDMYRLAEEQQAQLIVAGYYIDTYYSSTEFIAFDITLPSRNYSTQQEFREDAYRLFDRNLLYTPWNKLYLAEYIKKNKIRFPNTLWDDFPFNLYVIRDIEKVCLTSKQYYHFIRQRAESETAKYVPNMYQKREEEHQWLLELYNYWNISDEKSREFLARRYIERLVGCIENLTCKSCGLTKKQKILNIRNIVNKHTVKSNLNAMKTHSRMMYILLIPIKLKLVCAIYYESKIISYVKEKNTKLFSLLKAKR